MDLEGDSKKVQFMIFKNRIIFARLNPQKSPNLPILAVPLVFIYRSLHN